VGEPRDWCLVLETVSSEAASLLGDALEADGVDVDIERHHARVWCFAEDEEQLRQVEQLVDRAVEEQQLLQRPPLVRVWSPSHHHYVDPANPDEAPHTGEVWIGSDLEPREIRWRVRLELESVFEFRRVRRQLPALSRPVIHTGNRTIDLGARDPDDAQSLAERAIGLEGVASTHASELKGWFARWIVRQRVAGNYATGPDGSGPGGYDFSGLGWGDSGGGGGGGGNGGGGGGGHHG
jgi:hypothetical protein